MIFLYRKLMFITSMDSIFNKLILKYFENVKCTTGKDIPPKLELLEF